MTYFILSRSVEPKIVGVTHGAGQFTGSENYSELNLWTEDVLLQSKTNISVWAEHKLYAPKAHLGLVLEKKAKKTDYIGDTNMRGFYVNEKLKTILESCHLPNHRFIPTIFFEEKTGQEINEYYRFVYDMETGEHTVNFSKCEFDLKYLKQKLGDNFTVNIKNYEDYMKVFYETGSGVRVSKLVFNKNFDRELDLFGCQFLTLEKSYISERLKLKMEAANITGCEISNIGSGRMLAELLGEKVVELVFE